MSKKIEIFNFIDGAGNDIRLLHMAIDTLAALIDSYPRVLVYCHAGRSRSPTIVAGYFIKYQNMSVESALQTVANKRKIGVASGLKKLLYYLE